MTLRTDVVIFRQSPRVLEFGGWFGFGVQFTEREMALPVFGFESVAGGEACGSTHAFLELDERKMF
jgi:hypothetical protein